LPYPLGRRELTPRRFLRDKKVTTHAVLKFTRPSKQPPPVTNVHEYDIADLPGHSTTPGETRNTKVTRGYAHGVPQRLRDAVNSLQEGKRLVSATPTLRRAARGA